MITAQTIALTNETTVVQITLRGISMAFSALPFGCIARSC